MTDEGYDIEVRYLESLEHGMSVYEARWYNPVGSSQGSANFRFVIAPRNKQNRLLSSPFRTNNSEFPEKNVISH